MVRHLMMRDTVTMRMLLKCMPMLVMMHMLKQRTTTTVMKHTLNTKTTILARLTQL
jgi:hypothetical protein